VSAYKPLNPGIASERPVPTLGDLLYRKSAGQPTSEAVWVALVRAMGGGDQAALREIYERMHGLVFTLIMRIVGNRQTAEELTIDVFHDVWRRAAGYDDTGGTVVGWIMNQARSRAIDRTRFDHRLKRKDPFPDGAEPADERESAEVCIDNRARDGKLREAVARLHPHERNAIEMAYFSECTHAEVAERLSEPLGTVKTRIRSGLRKLQQALAIEDPS
jgi:RNA polymerase sigma-70 factor (ECF subfamily)